LSAHARLLEWYDRARRDLPWRRRRDAWSVWVSEIMLQQTRVETALRYFEPFLERFPSPEALAAAPVEEVLAAWSGLGYYGRARRLQAGARAVAAGGGGIPRRAAELAALPGIGPYTAAAVASIAFDEVVPVLDGNVARVVSRRLGEGGKPGRAAVRRRLLAAAAALLDPRRPGDSNQALMELGATLCTPRAPRCPECPLAAGCAAREAGDPERFPRPRRRSPTRRVRHVAALVTRPDGGVLLVRRGEGETLLPGLWELPTVEARGRRAAETALAARYGGRWTLGPPAAKLRHGITFRAVELEARRAEWRSDGVCESGEAGWFAPAEAERMALTGATRRLLARGERGAARESPRATGPRAGRRRPG
jgi:A/G-specific adenine glycosylase